MSGLSIIHDLTVELRTRIFEAMNSANGVSLEFTDQNNNITLSSPATQGDAQTRLSLYLYHIGINNSLRNQQKLAAPGSSDSLLENPLPIELKYLITPMSDELNNQLIVGRLLQYFYDFPLIETVSGQSIGNSFGGASRQIRITPALMTVEQLSQLWNAFNQSYRLALAFHVDVVAIDSAKAPQVSPRVAELIASAGHVGEAS